jgi:hypothetical protein
VEGLAPSKIKEETSPAKPTEKKWWYACMLFGTNCLNEGAMWHIDPLLGNDHETNNNTMAAAMHWAANNR